MLTTSTNSSEIVYLGTFLEDSAGFLKEVVKAKSRFLLDVQVTEESVVLEWSFKTESHDIGFALYHGEENENELIPTQRLESHQKVQDGGHICETKGKYTFVFDNSYSYTRSKTLYYKIDIGSAKAHTNSTDTDKLV
jgi:hypothetical protein